jgi:flavin-dependent dehydrogenase
MRMADGAFDTIVVGARCAGASLATHLAKAGQKVLLLDAAKLPSDHPLSTHFISPRGIDWLDELGAGDEVRALAPPCHGVQIDMLGAGIKTSYARGRAARCPRRLHLDRILQERAVRAGADLRDRTKVVGLVREGGRVVGVQAVHGDVRSEYRARVVVGADGRHSQVAELAGAKEYLAYDNPRFGYWAYWPRKAWDGEQSRLGAYLSFDERRMLRFVFQTDSDLLLVMAGPPLSELDSWKGRFEEAYLEAVRGSPVTAAIVEGSTRATDLVGILKMRYFFREAAGPGFALVGDAGLHKDPTPGYGITDALRDARNLAPAILAGGDEALLRYWRQRDLDSIELFSFARYMGDPAYVNKLNERLYKKAVGMPEVMARMSAQMDRELSPFEVVTPGLAISAMLGAVFTGNFSAWPAFLAAGKVGTEVKRAKQQCVDALAALGSAAPADALAAE